MFSLPSLRTKFHRATHNSNDRPQSISGCLNLSGTVIRANQLNSRICGIFTVLKEKGEPYENCKSWNNGYSICSSATQEVIMKQASLCTLEYSGRSINRCSYTTYPYSRIYSAKNKIQTVVLGNIPQESLKIQPISHIKPRDRLLGRWFVLSILFFSLKFFLVCAPAKERVKFLLQVKIARLLLEGLKIKLYTSD